METNLKETQATESSWNFPDKSTNSLVCAALLQIAKHTKLMAASYDKIIKDREYFEKWYNQELAKNQKLRNQIRGYKSRISRMKNKK